MNKKTMLLGATALVLGGLVISPKLVEAYQGDPSVQGPNCTAERHEANQIRQELGLGQRDGSGQGRQKGRGMGRWGK